MTEGRESRTAYHCVTGHEIPRQDLDSLTEVRSLDEGALVRICREHGSPIAITVSQPALDMSNGDSRM